MPTPMTRAEKANHGVRPIAGGLFETLQAHLLDLAYLVKDKPPRSMSRRSSANVLGGIGALSDLRKPSRRSVAFFSFGLNPRMPNRAKAPSSS